MFDDFLAGLSALFARSNGSGRSRLESLDTAYRAAFEAATASADFSDEVLWQELREHSVPGAWGERDGKRIGAAFDAWDQRIDPTKFYRFVMKRGI